ncbi:MAG: polyprenyl synthetase family protein [Dethiobacter sp.]|jgi:geranylgeranyl diphosphate synthase type II|nr:polyprenyl synthetase family protein [Dethiobacter sp.]MBS3901949.1 polyprenyl synthetase family protein [Dethiobacter sp.]MBS3988772.1 polyprenyl synthetase family protein [Dethiobacter sp.]
MTFEISKTVAQVDEALNRLLPPEDTFPPEIHGAIRYSVFAGGKRLRPLLTLSAAEIFGVPQLHAMPAACSLEMVHTYSLIHDDLPALDNDNYRRGRFSNHKVYGEAIAILAGDALLTMAFETLAGEASAYFPAATVVRLMEELSKAAGVSGMIGGQVADILSEGKQVSAERLDYIHRHKTGALFSCAIRSGAIMGGASLAELRILTSFADKMGLAFQIVDDLLDITGEQALLGKKTGADAERQKATYPALFGLDAAQKRAVDLLFEAEQELEPFGEAAASLYYLAQKLVHRQC